jgi:hypothetical protein
MDGIYKRKGIGDDGDVTDADKRAWHSVLGDLRAQGSFGGVPEGFGYLHSRVVAVMMDGSMTAILVVPKGLYSLSSEASTTAVTEKASVASGV